jgi:hypothetical protein
VDTRRAATLLIAGLGVLAACSGSEASDAGAPPETSTEATTSPAAEPIATTDATTDTPTSEAASTSDADSGSGGTDATTAPTTGGAPGGGALVGQWIADTGEVLGVLTEPFGGGVPACSGPYVVTFGEDGSFTATIDATCVVGDIEAVGDLGVTGRYTDDGTTLQVSDSAGEGAMTVGGVAMPLPILDGLTEAFGPPAQYTITGDVLSIMFTSPDGLDYTLEFTRA